MLRLVSLAPLAALPLDCTGKNLSWRSGVIIGDHPTRKTVRILSVGPHGASKVAFSPDGHTLAIGRSDGIDALYDLRTGRRTGKLVGAGSIDDIDFSPDGKLLASASLTGTVTLWNVARRSKLRDLPGAILLYAVRFSPDGKLVAVGDSSGTVIFWDTASGRRVGAPLAGHGGGVDSIDFDPDGKTLVTSTDDGKLRLWDVATRKLIGAALPGSNTGGSVHFFPDGKHSSASFNQETGSFGMSIPLHGRRRPAASPAATSPMQNGSSSSAAATTATSVNKTTETTAARPMIARFPLSDSGTAPCHASRVRCRTLEGWYVSGRIRVAGKCAF